MHTLQILLNGKWDPISLLEDRDHWSASQAFVAATGHAASAAEALNTILEYDPGLGFMPFFFGIYLLQGSFLFLLMASKLQGPANVSIAHACHVFVRAHEVCNTTVNAEYQVSVSASHYSQPPSLNLVTSLCSIIVFSLTFCSETFKK